MDGIDVKEGGLFDLHETTLPVEEESTWITKNAPE